MTHEFDVNFIGDSHAYDVNSERTMLKEINPKGFTIRNPPNPHELDSDITHDTQLFQTIHMGAAVVDPDSWRLVIDGMVERPFSIDLVKLKKMPSSTITTFHECYGSPIKPPTTPLWRIGNVRWTGVRLSTLLEIARPSAEAEFIWSEGLEHGKFASVTADSYQKDLPIQKAMRPEVLLAYEMNGEPLTKERGFPVRLIVPGWFGTNSTKWICHLSVQDRRAPGPFTTVLYNELDPHDPSGKKMRPVWAAEVNSMICRPRSEEKLRDREVVVWGRAWGGEEVKLVEISVDGGETWSRTRLASRTEFEWQRFETTIELTGQGTRHRIMARAVDVNGISQPMTGRRNSVHCVEVEVL